MFEPPYKKLFTLLLLFGIFGLVKNSQAADYYVSPEGTASWISCTDIDTPCSLASANANVVAGDIVYLRGGTYIVSATNLIAPAASGNLSNQITYQAYSAGAWNERETPILQGSPPSTISQIGAYLTNDYAVVKGILFEDLHQAVLVYGGNYNEVGPDNEIYHTGLSLHGTDKQPGIFIHTASTNNWIHHNEVHYMGFSGCAEGHDGIKVGHSTDTASINNTLENNLIYNMGHSVVDIFGYYNVVRNNIAHQEGWKPDPGTCNGKPDAAENDPGNGKFAHRLFSISKDDVGGASMHTLFEGNRAGYGSLNPTNAGSEGIAVGGPGNIIRYNYFFGSDGPGIYFKKYSDGTNNFLPTNNMVYNNTVYSNGRYTGLPLQAPGINIAKFGITYLVDSDGAGVKNNILNSNVSGDVLCYGCVGDEATEFPNSAWANNLCDNTNSLVACTAGTPTFDSTDMSDMTSLTQPTLALTAGSSGIDGGANLTQASGSGSSSTTLVVDNALYFQAGSSASTNPMGASISDIQADYIAIGTVNNTVQISDINYTTNTITLSSAMTWSDNDNIWLFKKSDGTAVLQGSAPDQGAYEYISESYDTTPPNNPSGLSVL